MTLHSHTWRVDAALDPFAVAADDGVLWLHDGRTLAGRGVAAVLAQ